MEETVFFLNPRGKSLQLSIMNTSLPSVPAGNLEFTLTATGGESHREILFLIYVEIAFLPQLSPGEHPKVSAVVGDFHVQLNTLKQSVRRS